MDMSLFRRFISLLLVVSMASAPFATWAGPDDEEKKAAAQQPAAYVPLENVQAAPEAIAHEQAPLLQLANELDTASETTYPGPTVDTFHITNQQMITTQWTPPNPLQRLREATIDRSKPKAEWISENSGTYQLTDFNLPLVVPGDFERDVSFEINREAKTISLVYNKKGREIARHVLNGYDVVTASRDQELYTFLDASGKIFSIDAALAKFQAFRGPLPVFEVARLDMNTVTGPLGSSFLSRGLSPMEFAKDAIMPMDVENDPHFLAGDFLLYENHGGRRLLRALFDRNVIRQNVYNAEAVLAITSFMAAPTVEAQEALTAAAKFQQDPEVRDRTQTELSGMDPLVSSVLRNMSPEAIANLVARAQKNTSSKNEIRDRFTAEEWFSDFIKLKQRAIVANSVQKQKSAARRKGPYTEDYATIQEGLAKGDLQDSWRALTQDGIHQQVPGLLHRIMNGAALKWTALIVAGTAAAAGFDQVAFNGVGRAWAVHLIHSAWDRYAPDVLKDEVYRWTLAKSSISLLGFIPLMHAVGVLSAKFIYKKAWSPAKALAKNGMIIFATLVPPFYLKLAELLKQPNLVRAAQRGINPLVRVYNEDGDLVRPALNSTFLRGEELKETLNRNAALLNKVGEARKMSRALSWALAVMVVSENGGYDPVTLTELAQRGGMGSDQMEKLMKTPAFREKWAQTAKELEVALLKLKTFSSAQDLKELSPEDFILAYRTAKETAVRIESRKGLKSVLGKLRFKWLQISETVLPRISSHGLSDAEFLKNADPNEFVSRSFFKQFLIDFTLSIAQVAVWGDRAKLSKPEALAAQYKDEHFFLWTRPEHFGDMSDQVRIYGLQVPSDMALVYQKRAIPHETDYNPIEDITLQGKDVREGFFTGVWEYMKGVADIRGAQYAQVFLRGLTKRINVIQANMVLSVLGRVLLARQPLAAAIPASLWSEVEGPWGYRWLWTPINRGNQRIEERFEGLNAPLQDGKVRLGQGLRVKDWTMAAEGYMTLGNLYNDSAVRLPPETETFMREVEKFLKNPDLKAVDEAQAEISDFYERFEKSGKTFLDFVVSNPPHVTRAHPAVEWLSTTFGAIVTTLWATTMFVQSYEKNVSWGARMWHSAWKAAAIYTAVWYGQKIYLHLADGPVRQGLDRAKYGPANIYTSTIGFNQKDEYTSKLIKTLEERKEELGYDRLDVNITEKGNRIVLVKTEFVPREEPGAPPKRVEKQVGVIEVVRNKYGGVNTVTVRERVAGDHSGIINKAVASTRESLGDNPCMNFILMHKNGF